MWQAGRRPLPPIISHSFPLSNCALSSIGSRKLPVQVEVEVLLLSHRKIPLQLCSQQRTGVKPITNGGKSYFSSHQVCKMLCFIVIWRYLDSLGGDIKKLKSGNSSTTTQIASLVDFPKHYCKHHLYHHHHRNHHRPHNHYEHQNHHHHCQLDHLRHSRGDNDVPGPLFTVIRYPTQFFTRFWCKSC